MEYADHDRPEADATAAFPVFARPGTDGVRYADSGFLPGGALPGGALPSGFLPGGAPSADGRPEGGEVPGGRFPQDGWHTDGETGLYPVVDWYAGYERYAGEQPGKAGQSTAAAGDPPFTRAYARPADPRQAPAPAESPEPLHHDHWSRPGTSAEGASAQPPYAFPGGLPLAGYPAQPSPAGPLARLRPDRWLLAGGSLAAAVAVVVAFATAGGSAATPGSRAAQTATTHVAPPACVSPVPGH